MGYVKSLMMDDEQTWCEDVMSCIYNGHEDFFSFMSEVMTNLTHPNPNLTEQEVIEELEWLWEEQVSRHADAH